MQEITMFILEHCPYCRKARGYMEELYKENPAYRDVPLTVIDEGKEPELAAQYNYYYVPTYYLGEDKVSEGDLTIETVRGIFDRAMQG